MAVMTGARLGASMWNVCRERHLLRRSSLELIPVVEGLAVAADVLARSADRDEDAGCRGSVDQLSPHMRRDAREFSLSECELLLLGEQGERAAHNQVDLLLLAMAMNPPPLAGLKRQLIEANAGNTESPPERAEALTGGQVDLRPGYALALHQASQEQYANIAGGEGY
jgi:hypothetical protein